MLRRVAGLGPCLGSHLGDLAGVQGGQAGEHVAQVGEGIDAPTAAAFHDGVEDGGALPGIGGPDEQPVFLVMLISA